jgi:hypothetical protein
MRKILHNYNNYIILVKAQTVVVLQLERKICDSLKMRQGSNRYRIK